MSAPQGAAGREASVTGPLGDARDPPAPILKPIARVPYEPGLIGLRVTRHFGAAGSVFLKER